MTTDLKEAAQRFAERWAGLSDAERTLRLQAAGILDDSGALAPRHSVEAQAHMLEEALKRPLNYAQLSPREQWAIDARLGILDWDPTPAEAKEFKRRWAEKIEKEK